MTMTANAPANGRAQQQHRKSLSSQLDRFDNMLDGLDQAIKEVIADAVKEAVTIAVGEAVRTTLVEIVTNPDVLALLRGNIGPASELTPAPAAASAPAGHRVGSGMARAWRWTAGKLKSAGRAAVGAPKRLVQGVANGYRRVNSYWRLKRPILIALTVGVVVGAVGYAAAPWMAGVLAGVAATGATLGAQLAVWTRRLFAAVPGH